MMTSEQERRVEQNVQRTVGAAALRKIRGIVDEDAEKEMVRTRLLRAFLSYGWIVLLAAAALLALYLGVI